MQNVRKRSHKSESIQFVDTYARAQLIRALITAGGGAFKGNCAVGTGVGPRTHIPTTAAGENDPP